MPQIIPAILTNNFDEYKNKLKALEDVVSRVQIDIIDGKFADNRTIGVKEISSIKTSLFLEAHLMIKKPENYIEDFVKAGVKLITVHVESCKNRTSAILDKIHALGIEAGIAVNPETQIKLIENIIDKADLVLLMSVYPGFGGQKFIPRTLNKIKELRKLSPTIPIEVDGGINFENVKKIAKAGANYLVVGSSLFKNGVNKTAIKELLEEYNKKNSFGK